MIMIFSYLSVLCAALVGIALAAIATQKNLIAIVLAVELIFVASTLALADFFSYGTTSPSAGLILFVAIWAVAAIEAIALIAFYVYMKAKGHDLEIDLLSRLKW